jgi:hypothetical protein
VGWEHRLRSFGQYPLVHPSPTDVPNDARIGRQGLSKRRHRESRADSSDNHTLAAGTSGEPCQFLAHNP